MKRDFLTIRDLSQLELNSLIKRAIELKAGSDASRCPLIGRSIGLIFEKPSTRTRVSFEVAVYQLGGQSIYMNPREIQIGRGETTADTARVLSRYLSGIVLRTHSHQTVIDLARHATVPVINGLSDMHHPCQALADLMTVFEKKKRFDGMKMAYIGDGNNVAHSLIEASAMAGMHLVLACPEGYDPDGSILENARREASGKLEVLRDPSEAARNADVIYTDVWVSMGQEQETHRKRASFEGFVVNDALLAFAKNDVIVLHCLPAHRGEEITDEVMDGPHSAVFDQAENRLHTSKALLEFLLSP